MQIGKVKWFNNKSGIGFITSDAVSEDIFVHYSNIQMEGYKTIKPNQEVEFELDTGDKGVFAKNIRLTQKG